MSVASTDSTYCGPHVYTFAEIAPDGILGPLVRAIGQSTVVGTYEFIFNEVTPQDFGIYTFRVDVELQYFPDVTWTALVEIEYLCPLLTTLLTLEEMPQIQFTYDVTLLQPLQAVLPVV